MKHLKNTVFTLAFCALIPMKSFASQQLKEIIYQDPSMLEATGLHHVPNAFMGNMDYQSSGFIDGTVEDADVESFNDLMRYSMRFTNGKHFESLGEMPISGGTLKLGNRKDPGAIIAFQYEHSNVGGLHSPDTCRTAFRSLLGLGSGDSYSDKTATFSAHSEARSGGLTHLTPEDTAENGEYMISYMPHLHEFYLTSGQAYWKKGITSAGQQEVDFTNGIKASLDASFDLNMGIPPVVFKVVNVVNKD